MRELAFPFLSVKTDLSFAFIPPHECVSSNSLSERCRFCRTCGIYMPIPLSRGHGVSDTKFLRSNRFSFLEPNFSNFNTVIEELIARQSFNRYYNTSLSNTTFRGPAILWIECLCTNLSFSLTTFYLSVAYVDAILSLYTVKQQQLKLICYICVILAAKMEETDRKIPSLKQTVAMLNHEYTAQDIMAREKLVLNILGFQLNLKTPFIFLVLFFTKGFLSEADMQGVPIQDNLPAYIHNIENLAWFFMDMMVRNYEYYQFTSIAVAAAALTCARICAGIRAWSADLERLTFVSWDAIQECLRMLFCSFESEYPEMFRSFVTDKPQIAHNYQELLPKSTNPTADPFRMANLDQDFEQSTQIHAMSSSANQKCPSFTENNAHRVLVHDTEVEHEPHRKLTADTSDELLNTQGDDQQEGRLHSCHFNSNRPSHSIQSKRGLKRSLSRDFGYRA